MRKFACIYYVRYIAWGKNEATENHEFEVTNLFRFLILLCCNEFKHL